MNLTIIISISISISLLGAIVYCVATLALKHLEQQRIKTLLGFEMDMDTRKKYWLHMKEQGFRANSYKESYLNLMDRFCSLVLNGYFDGINIKEDYEDIIHDLSARFKLEEIEKYKNIFELHSEWRKLL